MGANTRIGKCCCNSYATKVAIAYHESFGDTAGSTTSHLHLIKSDLSTYQISLVDTGLLSSQASPWIMRDGLSSSVLHLVFPNLYNTSNNSQYYWYEGNNTSWTRQTVFNARNSACLPGINPSIAHGFSGPGFYTTLLPTVVHSVTRRYTSGSFVDETHNIPNNMLDIHPGGIVFDSNGYERLCAWNSGGTAHAIWRYAGSTTWTASSNVPNTYAIAYDIYNDNDYVLSYNTSVPKKIQLSIWNGSSWTTSDVVNVANLTSSAASLCVDSSGVCHVSYIVYDRDASYNGWTYHIWKTYYGNNSGGTFVFELVNEFCSTGSVSTKNRVKVCSDSTPVVVQSADFWVNNAPVGGGASSTILTINSKTAGVWSTVKIPQSALIQNFNTFDICVY